MNGSGNEAIDHTTIDTPSGSELYNLQGQRLTTPPAHGVYLLNGHKVVKYAKRVATGSIRPVFWLKSCVGILREIDNENAIFAPS